MGSVLRSTFSAPVWRTALCAAAAEAAGWALGVGAQIPGKRPCPAQGAVAQAGDWTLRDTSGADDSRLSHT